MSQTLLRGLKLRSQASCMRRSTSMWPALQWRPALISHLDSTGISMTSRAKHWEVKTWSARLKSRGPSILQTKMMDLPSPVLPVILWEVLGKMQRKQRLLTFPVSVTCSVSCQRKPFFSCTLWRLCLVPLDGPKNTKVSIKPEGLQPAGTLVTLSCSSRAKPPITEFTWFRTNQDGREEKINVSEEPVYSFNLTENGVYRCEASNSLGEESSTIELSIQGDCTRLLGNRGIFSLINEREVDSDRNLLTHSNIQQQFLSRDRGADADLSVCHAVILHPLQLACWNEWVRDFSPRLSNQDLRHRKQPHWSPTSSCSLRPPTKHSRVNEESLLKEMQDIYIMKKMWWD